MEANTDRVSIRIPVALAVLAALLVAGIVYREHTAKSTKQWNVATIAHYSNEWASASLKLQEQKKMNLRIERDLETQSMEWKSISNKLTIVSADTVAAETSSHAAAQTANAQLQRQNELIAELETERDGMSKTMDNLSSSMSKLKEDMSAVEHRLATSRDNRELLVQELKRLQTEKVELERRFHDLTIVRNQIRKLRNELSLSRRLEWIRRTLMGSFQGEEQLKNLASASSERTSFNLDVELHRDRTAKILPASSSLSDH